MIRIAITGANGRLGQALVEHFARSSEVHAIARAFPTNLPHNAVGFAVGAFNRETDFSAALSGVDCIIHCAALTVIADDQTEADFQIVNADATRRLGEQAVNCGVRRLVYVSSITVNGKHSGARPFRADDPPNPQSAYSASKLAAEQYLRALQAKSDLEVVVVRPPRIIWPELSGNLSAMASLIRRGVPLPFGLLDRNARDNVSSGKLVQDIEKCAFQANMAGTTVLVSDGKPMSTRALTLWLGEQVGRKPRLIPVPEFALRLIVNAIPKRLLGRLNRKEMLDELTKNLVVEG